MDDCKANQKDVVGIWKGKEWIKSKAYLIISRINFPITTIHQLNCFSRKKFEENKTDDDPTFKNFEII